MTRILCALYYGFARHLPPSTFPSGHLWKAIRYQVCRSLFRSCGRNVNVESGARFGSGRQITIGDNSGIGENALIVGEVSIGRNVMMGPEVMIFARNHEFSNCERPMGEQGNQLEQPVVIQEDVWIGARAILLPGISIGHGAVIGAASVVTSDVPAWAIVAGNPSRIIRFRKQGAATAEPPMTSCSFEVSTESERP